MVHSQKERFLSQSEIVLVAEDNIMKVSPADPCEILHISSGSTQYDTHKCVIYSCISYIFL